MNITLVRLRKVAEQLSRVADALETLLLLQYGYHTRKPSVDDTGEPASVDYADDLQTAVQELERLHHGEVREEENVLPKGD